MWPGICWRRMHADFPLKHRIRGRALCSGRRSAAAWAAPSSFSLILFSCLHHGSYILTDLGWIFCSGKTERRKAQQRCIDRSSAERSEAEGGQSGRLPPGIRAQALAQGGGVQRTARTKKTPKDVRFKKKDSITEQRKTGHTEGCEQNVNVSYVLRKYCNIRHFTLYCICIILFSRSFPCSKNRFVPSYMRCSRTSAG